jgi:response regulator RpfG family c-di-GMP phosphodiesterase
MRILLIQDSLSVREKVVFALESTFGASIVESPNLKKAVADFQHQKDPIELVICDLQQGSVQDFENFQHQVGQVPCVLCVDGNANRQPPVGWHVLSVVDRNHLIRDLLGSIQRLIDRGVIAAAAETVEGLGEYVKIRTKLLLSVCPLKADVYIRLSDKKFLKLFREGDRFEFADMEKYTVRKGIEYLYLKRGDTQEFIDKYNRDLEKMVAKTPTVSVEEMAQINDAIFETVQELGRSVGFTKDVQVMAKHHMKMTVKAMGKSPKLGNILARLNLFQGQYISAHSTLTSYLGCAIASHMEWASESTFQKITMASFLHDISLDNVDLAECEKVEDVRARGFGDAEEKEFREHPQKAAEVARTFHEVPPDVDVIIAQHHERPDGTGFPRKLSGPHIAPLACVFLVAHDMAKAALKTGAEFEVQAYMEQAKARFSGSQFRKIFTALEHLDWSDVGQG